MAASDEPSELDGLRERAYGPDADITDDPLAVARLSVLEALVRTQHAAHREQVLPEPSDHAETRADIPGSGRDAEVSAAALEERPWRSALRGRVGFTLGVAAVVVAVGAVAFAATSGRSSDPVADPGSNPSAVIPIVDDQRWSTSSAAGYDLFLDHLRDEVLSGPGMSELAPRLIRDELHPYGSLYGRTVWAGSTTDAQYCMIIADTPLPATTCIWIDDAYASASSLTLPSGSTTSAFDVSVIPGTPVTYTLLPGGQVTAAPVP